MPKSYFYAFLGVLIFSALIGIWWFSNQSTLPQITNFIECAGQGFPIMASYPRQCRANGQTFVEQLNNPALPTPSSSDLSEKIKVSHPSPNDLVISPLTVSGMARGTWFWEASFPVRLLDANRNVLVATAAMAAGDWMTENFVPFHATLTFSTPKTADGALVLIKDNPSGLPQNDAEYRIPIRFK